MVRFSYELTRCAYDYYCGCAGAVAGGGVGIEGLTFHDLRGTAVTRLSEAGATPQEIRPITGHSIDSIYRIIERYCARTDVLASSAVIKLEKHRG